MLDRQRLRDVIVLLLAITVIGVAAGWDVKIVGQTAFILAAMFFSIRPSVMPEVVRDLFKHPVYVQEFQEQMREDAEFNQAVIYCYNLSAQDHLRFVRLLTELRYKAGQLALKDASDAFKMERDSGREKRK